MRTRRLKILAGLLAASLLLVAGWSADVQAQAPGPRLGNGLHGDAPGPGGIGLMVTRREQDREQLMLLLEDRGCTPASLAVITDGRWHVFIPGGPLRLATDFPARLSPDTPFFVRCDREAPRIWLSEADDGSAITVDAGERIRITLLSNPTTGFSWQLVGEPSPAVLALTHAPIFVPESELLGASGTETFVFTAIGPGTTSVSLEYARPFEPGSATDQWSLTVSVR